MDIVKRLRGHAKGNAGGVRELLVLSADEIDRLRQQNAELVEALHSIGSVDADMVVPHRVWDGMTPKDYYEAGLLDGAMAVRDAVKTEAYSIIAKATGGE